MVVVFGLKPGPLVARGIGDAEPQGAILGPSK